MELASLRLAVCAAVLLPVTCIGQQCDTSAFTYNQSNGEYYMPGGTNSATNANQCSCLQQQWDTINQQIQTQHQNCLDANQNQPNVPNSGATPGSLCSRSSCQSLHDALYTTMAPREQQQMAACNASVAQYQAHLQAQQAAEQQQQAAEQAAQQQRTIELTSLKQQIAAMLKSSQDAAQARVTVVQQLQTRISQELSAATPQNAAPNSISPQGSPGASFTGAGMSGSDSSQPGEGDSPESVSAPNDVVAADSSIPNGQSEGVTVLDFSHPDSIPNGSPGVTVLDFNDPNGLSNASPGVTVLDFNDPNSLPKDSPGVSVIDFTPPAPSSDGAQSSVYSAELMQAADQGPQTTQASNGGTTNAAAADPTAAGSLPGADSLAEAPGSGDNFGESEPLLTKEKSEKLEAVQTVDEKAVDQSVSLNQSALEAMDDLPDTPENAALKQNLEDAVEEGKGLKSLFTNLKYGLDTANMVNDIASGKDGGDAFVTVTGDAVQTAIGNFLEGTVLEGPAGIVLPLFDSTATATEPQDVIGNPSASFQEQASALHWLYSVQFDQTQAANDNQVITASAQSFVMQQTSNFMNSSQFTLGQKQQAFGYLLREYQGHQALWSPQQVQQLQQYFFQLYGNQAGGSTIP